MLFMTSIAIENVSKTIRKQQVIRNVSINLQSGKIYGFQGINGSGKTMLMRLISGLILPTSGEIVIDGKRLGKDIAFPKSIGLFLEAPAFLDGYSGFQNLKMLASIQGKINDVQIRNALVYVGLNPNDKKKYRKYSLGMKQRLGIGAAIMESPDIIILDEPTNSLDESGVELVKALLATLRERGALVVVSCHDLSILRTVSDEILLLESGRVVGHVRVKDVKGAEE
jgi:ABC-2 type transport system ATP-binding protein